MKTLLNEEQLREGVERMARQINSIYDGTPMTIVGVMTGSVVLLADLIRLLEMPLRVGVVAASSYRGTATSPSELAINSDFMPDIKGRHVLVADDIFDTGRTMSELISRFHDMQPVSVRCAVLLRKRDRQEIDLEPDFIGFDIPDEFVVGYGLDYQDAYRNLPYVAALEAAEIGTAPP
jgi:hypoxanthine phosphoribosyltransferase